MAVDNKIAGPRMYSNNLLQEKAFIRQKETKLLKEVRSSTESHDKKKQIKFK